MMGRSFEIILGYKVYTIPFPVGDDAGYFVILDGSRHYFKSRLAVTAYLEAVVAAQA